MRRLFIFVSLVFLSACASVPDGIQPITGFEVNRYLGKWYEIARLENRFEKGLSNITAEYSLNKDGTVNVINRGYKIKSKRWAKAEGKAKFMGPKHIGSLKVSFFGPFYGGYTIIALDKKNYDYVMITGNDRTYFWILSRKPFMAPATKQALLNKAKALGFAVDKLILVDHSLVQPKINE